MALFVIFALAAAGVVAYLATRDDDERPKALPGKTGAAPAGAVQVTPVPAEIQRQIAEVIAMGNPDALRQLAHALEAYGASGYAEQLRELAREVEARQAIDAVAVQAASDLRSPGQPTAAEVPRAPTVDEILAAAAELLPALATPPAPPPPEPPAIVVAEPKETIVVPELPDLPAAVPALIEQARQELDPVSLAGIALIEHLSSTRRYSEDRRQVEAWQSMAGIGADGMYGPGTARELALRTRRVVPVPFYWSRTSAAKQKAEYTEFVRSRADAQPELSSQWLAQLPAIQRS